MFNLVLCYQRIVYYNGCQVIAKAQMAHINLTKQKLCKALLSISNIIKIDFKEKIFEQVLPIVHWMSETYDCHLISPMITKEISLIQTMFHYYLYMKYHIRIYDLYVCIMMVVFVFFFLQLISQNIFEYSF